MRTVNYDLYKGTTRLATTKDFDRALEWKQMGHSYKIRLEEIIPEASDSEKEYRTRTIAKKNAIRAERKAALG